MKTIELKTVPFVAYDQDQELDYKIMLQILMEAPEDPQKGADINEVRRSIRVLDALEDADGQLQLEDADADYLVRRVRAAKFTSNNRVFADFVDDIEKAVNG